MNDLGSVATRMEMCPCSEVRPKECADRALTCRNGGYIQGISESDCKAGPNHIVSCYDSRAGDSRQWNQVDACTCPPQYSGFSCKLASPDGCDGPTSFKGDFLSLTQSADADFVECSIDYNPILGSLLQLVDSRVEFTFLNDTVEFGLYTRRIITEEMPSKGPQTAICSEVSPEYRCSLWNCSSEYLAGGIVEYACNDFICSVSISLTCYCDKLIFETPTVGTR